MRHKQILRWFGIVAACVVALSIGTRPTVRAQPGADLRDLAPLEPEIYHVEAPPKTMAETKTWLMLQEKVAMNFPNETPLEDVVKYIRQATIDEKAGFPKGMPIYVDPQGLQDADKTLASTIQFEMEGMPIQKTLRLMLRQLGLTYEVDKDGLVFITSTACDDGRPLDHDEANWQAFDLLRKEIQALRAEVRALRRAEKAEQHAPVPTRGVATPPGPAGGMMGGGFR